MMRYKCCKYDTCAVRSRKYPHRFRNFFKDNLPSPEHTCPVLLLLLLLIIITKTVFMVLSLWQSHCESSPGSTTFVLTYFVRVVAGSNYSSMPRHVGLTVGFGFISLGDSAANRPSGEDLRPMERLGV